MSELHGNIFGMLTEKPTLVGTCRVCCGEVVKKIITIREGEPIYGPAGKKQLHKKEDGYYCTECGIRYEFPPPPKVP